MKRMYDSVRWRRARVVWLNSHPLCAMCKQMGRDTAATTIDHIIPHLNDYDLFWDQDNWQSLCSVCHSASKQMQDIHGYSQACSIEGMPLDKRHPWHNKEEQKQLT
jgi:5-methylcytosine-specific restriction protein A